MISACAQGCFDFLGLFLCPLEFVLKACVTDMSKLGYIQSKRVFFFSFFANEAKNKYFFYYLLEKTIKH